MSPASCGSGCRGQGQGTQTIHIEPGELWENGYAESFIGKFRDGCLNEEVFWNQRRAQVIMEEWRKHYNQDIREATQPIGLSVAHRANCVASVGLLV